LEADAEKWNTQSQKEKTADKGKTASKGNKGKSAKKKSEPEH
jgi:hypothetical protein